MSDTVSRPDDHEPDYKAAMLYHSDRADGYMAERDALAAEVEALRKRLDEAREADAETLAKWAHNFVSADRWKGRKLDALPPDEWDRLREETRQWWRDEATKILARISHVNETPKSEHDREDVLTELARAGQKWDASHE